MKIEIINPDDDISLHQIDEIADFLFHHLGQYGDPKSDIIHCLNYALNSHEPGNGLACLAKEDHQIIGATIINHTGMSGYIPENILVYIAVDENQRGQGIGRQLMQAAIGATKGGMALHVEPDNPAKRLYERMGFTNKYLEMRLSK